MGARPMLNHSEMTHAPGDREAAAAFYETIGFEVSDLPGFPWLVVTIDAGAGPAVDNVLYVNEATPAQLNLEQALAGALENDAELADKSERYLAIRRRHPQYVFHFGASVPTREDWQQRVDAVREANESHPLLKGRIDLDVREPGTTGAIGPASQAFIHTDVIAIGPRPFCLLLFDLQWLPPFDYDADMEPIVFPDHAAMV